MKRVSVFMDVEDPINPFADDAALDLALLFTQVGLRGSFCLTGEKCRTLKARGRTDVSAAFEPHCLGLHTDTHSYHPTTMELLADLPFERGCAEAYESEKNGFEAFVDLFARPPVFWGGAGNTWSPEITDALKRLKVPAYVYALTSMPDQAVHRFNGTIALPQALSISEDDWADDERAKLASARVLQAIDEIPQPWVGVFVGHPTRMRYGDFWDAAFYAGRTPPSPQFTEPVSVEHFERSKKNLRSLLADLGRRTDVVGVDDALEMPWQFRDPNDAERAYFLRETAAQIRTAANWPIHRPDLNLEGIVAKTLALSQTVQVGLIP